jgi:D-hydroxyproline dehydrogenase subunit beta
MPDIVIIGGGIIGAAAANEIASRGFSVTLVERDGLASGASGRNAGWFVVTPDPACEPMSRRSLEVYLAAIDGSVPVAFDGDDLGQVIFTFDAAGAEPLRRLAESYAAVGVEVERMEAADLAREEPALTGEIADAWFIRHGRRVDPGALTLALAQRARDLGADIRRHTTVRSLTTLGDRVTGVATDDGVISADTVIVAAGPWSERLVRPLGHALPVTGERGWLVELRADRGLLHHIVAEEGEGDRGDPPPTARRFSEDDPPGPKVSVGLHPTPDGTIVCGASHSPVLDDEHETSEAPRLITERAVRTIPALADTPLLGTRSGIRPVSPDDRPMVGWLGEGLFVATGHGSEGVILGGGTASLVGALIGADAETPFDAAPFDPLRFGAAGAGGIA